MKLIINGQRITPRWVITRLLIMLAALAVFWLHATLMQAKPAWIGLIVLGFESVVLLCLKIHEARRARRRQAERVTASEPDRWKWN
jgi:uncharacterized membrane protein